MKSDAVQPIIHCVYRGFRLVRRGSQVLPLLDTVDVRCKQRNVPVATHSSTPTSRFKKCSDMMHEDYPTSSPFVLSFCQITTHPSADRRNSYCGRGIHVLLVQAMTLLHRIRVRYIDVGCKLKKPLRISLFALSSDK